MNAVCMCAGPGLQACLLTAKGIEQVVGSINMDARPQSDILLVCLLTVLICLSS